MALLLKLNKHLTKAEIDKYLKQIDSELNKEIDENIINKKDILQYADYLLDVKDTLITYRMKHYKY